jgi:hypothetical protein
MLNGEKALTSLWYHLAGEDKIKMVSAITVYTKEKGGVPRIHQRKRVNTKQIVETKTAGFH